MRASYVKNLVLFAACVLSLNSWAQTNLDLWTDQDTEPHVYVTEDGVVINAIVREDDSETLDLFVARTSEEGQTVLKGTVSKSAELPTTVELAPVEKPFTHPSQEASLDITKGDRISIEGVLHSERGDEQINAQAQSVQ